jgi:hypothetical protein
MSDERRYGEEEVRRIFGLASKAQEEERPALSSGDGLTLAELTEIGREVGLEPERISAAAASLDVRGSSLPRRKVLGMPIGVGRTVELPRAPTDHEWQLLVAELRATFDARGKVTSQGGILEWTNGNLHAYVEPTESGHRLRLRTLKGSAMTMNVLGGVALSLSVVVLVVGALTGQLADELSSALIFATAAAAVFASNAVTLPRWADEREGQMEHIARTARALLSDEGSPS